MKLATELSKRATGKTFYILDEPTTGLHFDDVARLLTVLGRLVESGNTVVVIEHNLDVIKTADWVIDLGPEGGDKGGELIAAGTPEDVAANRASYTGQYLAAVLGVADAAAPVEAPRPSRRRREAASGGWPIRARADAWRSARTRVRPRAAPSRRGTATVASGRRRGRDGASPG